MQGVIQPALGLNMYTEYRNLKRAKRKKEKIKKKVKKEKRRVLQLFVYVKSMYTFTSSKRVQALPMPKKMP